MRTSFKELYEELKIKSKNWDVHIDGYKAEVNDGISHNLIDRIRDRTKLSLNDIKQKLQRALDFTIEQNYKQKEMVSVHFEKSDIYVLVYINPLEKYIRISSILDSNMNQSNTMPISLKEFQENYWVIPKEYHNNTFVNFANDLMNEGTSFVLEPNERLGYSEVQIQDIKRLSI